MLYFYGVTGYWPFFSTGLRDSTKKATGKRLISLNFCRYPGILISKNRCPGDGRSWTVAFSQLKTFYRVYRPKNTITNSKAWRLGEATLYSSHDSRFHYMEMAIIAITGIISRTGSWYCPKRKELPHSATSNGYYFAFSPIFRAPFGKYMPNQEVEIGKAELKGDYPVNFLDTWWKGIILPLLQQASVFYLSPPFPECVVATLPIGKLVNFLIRKL